MDVSGKHVVITGANTGIGRATAEALAAQGAVVVVAARSEDRARPVVDGIRARGGNVVFVPLDLGDFASVRACASRIEALERPVDVLVNNAGVAGQRGFTRDGYELHFGTNHLGHFLLTMLLWPRLRAAGAARIIHVASQAHYQAKGIDFEAVRRPTRSITGLSEYAVSKLANVIFAREIARRTPASGVTSYSLHPGVVASDAWRRLPWPIRALMKLGMISNEQGAKTTLHCVGAADLVNGAYYDECRVKEPSRLALDEALGKELWAKSVQFTGADLTAP